MGYSLTTCYVSHQISHLISHLMHSANSMPGRTCQLAHYLCPRLPELAIRDKQDVRVGPCSGVEPVQAACDGLIEIRASIEYLEQQRRFHLLECVDSSAHRIIVSNQALHLVWDAMWIRPSQGSPVDCLQRPCLSQAPAHALPVDPRRQKQSSRAPAKHIDRFALVFFAPSKALASTANYAAKCAIATRTPPIT